MGPLRRLAITHLNLGPHPGGGGPAAGRCRRFQNAFWEENLDGAGWGAPVAVPCPRSAFFHHAPSGAAAPSPWPSVACCLIVGSETAWRALSKVALGLCSYVAALNRHTIDQTPHTQNIVIGGVAGWIPPLVERRCQWACGMAWLVAVRLVMLRGHRAHLFWAFGPVACGRITSLGWHSIADGDQRCRPHNRSESAINARATALISWLRSAWPCPHGWTCHLRGCCCCHSIPGLAEMSRSLAHAPEEPHGRQRVCFAGRSLYLYRHLPVGCLWPAVPGAQVSASRAGNCWVGCSTRSCLLPAL